MRIEVLKSRMTDLLITKSSTTIKDILMTEKLMRLLRIEKYEKVMVYNEYTHKEYSLFVEILHESLVKDVCDVVVPRNVGEDSDKITITSVATINKRYVDEHRVTTFSLHSDTRKAINNL